MRLSLFSVGPTGQATVGTAFGLIDCIWPVPPPYLASGPPAKILSVLPSASLIGIWPVPPPYLASGPPAQLLSVLPSASLIGIWPVPPPYLASGPPAKLDRKSVV